MIHSQNVLDNCNPEGIGIFALNTANNQIIQYRAKEGFPLAINTKLIIVAAAALKKGEESLRWLSQTIYYAKSRIMADKTDSGEYGTSNDIAII